MEKSEFLQKITEIGSCEDDVERRSMLATLSEEVGKDYDSLSTLTTDNENLKAEREKLREANMELFLRVGETKSPDTVKENETGVKPENNTKLSFDDLFDGKGGIK